MAGRVVTPEYIFAAAARIKITKYVDVAALALLIVDYLGTLEAEIAYMWPAELSAAKVLFFLCRYLALFDVPLAIYYHTSLGLPVRTCRILFSVETTSLLTGVALAEAILFLRVYALSGRDSRLLFWLIFQFLSVHIAEFVVLVLFLRNLQFGPSPLPTVLGCTPLPPKSQDLNIQLSALFGLILANELAILLITFIIGLVKYRNLQSPLIRIFYRDGFFYFLILSAISAGNITADLVGPPEYRFLIVILQRVMHSILSTRMILHMRNFASGSTEDVSSGATLTAGSEPVFRWTPKRHGQNPWFSWRGRGRGQDTSLMWDTKPRMTPTVINITRSTTETVGYFPGAMEEEIELERAKGGVKR